MNKKCSYFRSLFGPYIEDKIDTEQRKELAAHLSECKECSLAFSMEWRTKLEEKTKTLHQRKRNFPVLSGFASRKRLTFLLLIVSGLAVIIFARTGFKRKNNELKPSSLDKLVNETVELLRSNQRLNEALIFTALKNKKPLPRKIKFEAMKALEGARKALGQGKKDDILKYFHPLFRYQVFTKAGTIEKTIPLSAIINNPSEYSELLDVEYFEWWSVDDETISLYSFGSKEKKPIFLLFMKTKNVYKLYWIAK